MATDHDVPCSAHVSDTLSNTCPLVYDVTKDETVEDIRRCLSCQNDLIFGECVSYNGSTRAVEEIITLIEKHDVGREDGIVFPDLTQHSCEDIQCTPKLTTDTKNTTEPKTVANNIGQLTKWLTIFGFVSKRTQHVKQAREEDLERLITERNTAVKNIDDKYEAIKTRLDDLRAASIAEVHATFTELSNAITSDIHVERSRDVISQLRKEEARIKSAQEGGEADRLVCVEQGQTMVRESSKVVHELEKSGGESFHVTVDDTILACVNGLRKFATVARPTEPDTASEKNQAVRMEHIGRSDKLELSVEHMPTVSMQGDQNVCIISDCCLLENGSLILTDENNACVKLFDKSYRAIDRCTVLSDPIAVCLIGDDEVAITLYGSQNVQIASVDQTIRLTRDFSVGEGCTGASYHNNKLYITCEFKKVRVYDIYMYGSLQQTIGHGRLGGAWHSSTSRTGGCLVTNGPRGIVSFDSYGRAEWMSQHEDLKYAMGICEVDDLVLVGCSNSGHVFQVNRADHTCSILLLGSGELNAPRSLTYDQSNNRLIITKKYCAHMLVYTLIR